MSDQNHTRLARMINNADDIRNQLSDQLRQANGDVHFRPTASGVTMVGLLPGCPQLGHGPYRAARLAADFQTEFDRYCRAAPKRLTPEKEVQSFLIRDAYQHGRRMAALSTAPGGESGPIDMLFITDELALIQENGAKIVCDILALRPNANDQTHGVPVIIELKSARQMARLVAQLHAYAQAMQQYYTAFEQLYAAVLGQDIYFGGPPECWLVWPAFSPDLRPDPRAQEVASQGVQVVQYAPQHSPFRFDVSA
jgi:hypothetical protein